MSEIYSKSSDNSKEMDKNKLSIFNDDNIKNREDYKDLKGEYNYVGEIIKKQTGNNLKGLSEEIDILNLSSKDLLDKFIDSDFESSNGITQEDKKQYLLFLSDIIKDALNGDLNLINIKNIDIDGNKKLSLFELKQIKSQIQTNFIDIKKMGSYESFLDVYKDIDDDINGLSITDNIDNLLGGKTISESLVNNIGDISKQDADKLLSSKWGDDDFGKGILFAISREVPQMAEDILIFLADLPGALLSLPQYLYYNFRDGYAYDMKVRSMEQKHPVLGLVGLLKNGGEVLTKLASELGSPSNWTAGGIVLSITAIVGLLAGGAGAVKLASKAGKLGKVGKGLERLDRTINFSEHAAINSVGKIAFNAPKIHEINNIPTKELITIDDNGLLKFYSNDHFRDIDGIEFEKLLIEKIDEFESINGTKVKKIDISEFNNIEHKYLKEKIYNIVGNNFPLLEVSRLTEGSKVVDITFLGIKTLNDNISKEFVDLFNNSLKSYLHKNFYKNSGINPYGRIVRDNYKHMTFSMNSSNDISNTIFGNIKNKTKLLEFIFDNLDKNKLNLALSEAKVKDLESVKNILLNEFDFGIGTTIVKKSNNGNEISLSDKLESFYKAEISSRNKVDLSNLGDNLEFNFENIISFAKEALNQEKDIINKYNGKKFIFNSTEFDVIVNGKINSILLRYVRKGEDIGDKDLKLLVGNYINSLNDGFDFIAPFVEKTQLEDIGKIETQIERGIIDIDLLKNTYKNTLSVNALKLESKGKEGLRVFIDIVDMGIMNLNDFRKLASRIVSGDIKKEDLSDLLSAGQTATNRFQNLVSSIKKSYPNAKISLGGDEVFLFIPGKTQLESQKIITDLTSKLKNEDLVGRISNSTNKDNDKIFDNLDGFTSINKFFEKKVEKIINNNSNVKVKNFGLSEIKTLRDLKFFTSINLNIDKKVQKIISENTSNFLIDLKNIIDYNMIKALIIGKKDSYNISFDIFDRNIEGMTMGKISNFNLNVSKASNNELIISIK